MPPQRVGLRRPPAEIRIRGARPGCRPAGFRRMPRTTVHGVFIHETSCDERGHSRVRLAIFLQGSIDGFKCGVDAAR
jgi:hypothetical protein